MPDSLIYFGGAIKALDENGKVGGYLVRFSDDGSQKDLSGEYFTSKTYLGARDGDGVDTIFHHGQPLPVKANLTAAAKKQIAALQDYVFAPVKTKRDAVGIWAETVLDLANEYEKEVFGLVKKGKLGWSSGGVSHLVKKSSDGQITRWPIGEASMTPSPAEPLNRVYSIETLDTVKFVPLADQDKDPEPAPTDKPAGLSAKLNQHIDDLADDRGRDRAAIIARMAREAGIEVKAVEAMLANRERPTDARLKAFARVLNVSFEALKAQQGKDYAQTIKGMFQEAIAEHTPSRWELESTYCRIVKRLANAAAAAQLAGVEFDLAAKVKEATDEYTNLLQQHAIAQIESWMEDGGEDDFYFKAILDAEARVKSFAAADLDTHSQLTVSVLREIAARFRGNHEGRVKAGRMLSEKNRQRISSLMESCNAVIADMQSLLDESQPMATDAAKRAALTKHLMLKHKHQSSIGA